MIEIYGLSFSFINILTWVAFGLVAGIIGAAFTTSQIRGGLFGAILLGVVGALSGGALATFILGIGMRGFDLIAFATATFGAILFLILRRALLVDKRRIHSRISLS